MSADDQAAAYVYKNLCKDYYRQRNGQKIDGFIFVDFEITFFTYIWFLIFYL